MRLINWWKRRKRSSNRRSRHKYRTTTFSRWRFINVGIITLFAGVAVYFFLRSDYFLLRTIEVDTPDEVIVEPGEVKEIATKHLNRSIFQIDTRVIEEEVKATYLPIDEVVVEKKLPDRLSISYREKTAVLAFQWQERSYLVDSDGLVFAQSDEKVLEGLPQIQLNESYFKGDEVLGSRMQVDGLRQVTDLAEYNWSRLGLKVSWFSLREDSIDMVMVDLKSNPADHTWQLKLSLTKSALQQLKELEIVLLDARQQGKQLQSVDLRFARPVIIYQ